MRTGWRRFLDDGTAAKPTSSWTAPRAANHAFRLIVSDQVPPPPGIDPGKWQDMVVKTEVPGGRHLLVGKEYLEVVVDSRRPTPPKVGTNDF
jgi:hypothetical protein